VTTRIFLVRHGATELTAEDRFAGATDVLLSDSGRDQARLLGVRLAGESLAAVYASPMRRTMVTAELASATHGLTVSPVEGLREINHGRWEGKTRKEVDEQFPEEATRECWDVAHILGSQGRQWTLASSREDQHCLTKIVEERRRISIARINLIPDSLELASIQPTCYESGLSSAWRPHYADSGAAFLDVVQSCE